MGDCSIKFKRLHPPCVLTIPPWTPSAQKRILRRIALVIGVLFLSMFKVSYVYAEKCEHETEAIMFHEQRIMKALKTGTQGLDKQAKTQIFDSLACLIEIEQKGKGWTKYLAHSFLQPFLGGGQIAGVPLDQRYGQVSSMLTKMAELSKDPAHMSLLEAHSKGEWGFYSLMCEQGSVAYCNDFLPEVEKILSQPPLIAASSMLLLKMAYLRLSGDQQQKVAEKIRVLHRSVDKSQTIQRRVIDQIHKELFDISLPLSMIS